MINSSASYTRMCEYKLLLITHASNAAIAALNKSLWRPKLQRSRAAWYIFV